ncbi:SGNH/GDSL hydrolase family protein [Saxibacter everestensis]|uniref:SGNH/GDSL hydrolase family protein n=1 Tax=Saxibacter everestensis TaxID=2909229 RepID=A0ABY8QUG4_9MICO|nr:SGNH/GDSL hydrolase family protein [Brevibacteriaceae bacterium ZFBP1038]
MTYTSYCALGDSFSEGMNDPAPDGAPDRYRGWADRLAELLTTSTTGSPDLTYANLAIRGRLLDAIIAEQVPRALELKPDLVSLVGGGNDCIRPGADPDALAAKLDDAVVRLQESGATVLLATGFDTRMTPLLRAIRGRVGIFNANIWTIAQRRGAFVLDSWGLKPLHDLSRWSEDRLHLSAEGHEIVAQQALAVLEGRPTPEAGQVPVARPARPLRQAVNEEAAWVRQHLAPWVGRRIRRTSSGDGRSAKEPELRRVRM